MPQTPMYTTTSVAEDNRVPQFWNGRFISFSVMNEEESLGGIVGDFVTVSMSKLRNPSG